ncbi:MAG TPA: hypothetical protein VN748_03825 [Pseudonocardiaceae bacterium]|jgi:hypothetical protein|nr:hypothetical protein [Pseudonocardiaceae bacterium]
MAALPRGLSSVSPPIEPLIFSDNYGERSFNFDIPEHLPALRALFNNDEFNADGKKDQIRPNHGSPVW